MAKKAAAMSIKLYEPHPLALLFPSIDDGEIDVEMATSIKQDGLQNKRLFYVPSVRQYLNTRLRAEASE